MSPIECLDSDRLVRQGNVKVGGAMFCRNCGISVTENVSYCPRCGAPLAGNSPRSAGVNSPLLYQSSGCTAVHRGMIIVGIIFGVLFGAGLWVFSSHQVDRYQYRRPTAEEEANYKGEGVLGLSLDTVRVDAFDDKEKMMIRGTGAVIGVIIVAAGFYTLNLANKSTISVYLSHVEGVPYSHGLRNYESSPGFTRIDSGDIASVRIVDKKRGAIRIQTRSGRKESFLCKDATQCVSAIQSAMR